MSRRVTTVLALLGLLLCAAAPAEAARTAKKSGAAEKKKATRKSDKKTRRTGDTSLRGRFAKIPTPRVPGASKLRLEFKPSGAGDGGRGKVFSARKLKAKGPAGPTFREKVLASTRKGLRKQR
ncbi:MAG TPA: hypothetical protein VMZ28_13310 [Kofleriaceae bacterium]|nr:hypothetical protein [Kofleriaceae bacterium]